MAISPTEKMVRFGLFELDIRTRQLTKNGIKIRLPQQPIQILELLLERPSEIVTREELRRRLWPSDVFVDFDHGLNKSIQKLREALGDSANSPRYIETIPRIGYRFIAPVNGASRVLETEPYPEAPHNLPSPATTPPTRPPARWSLLAASVLGVAACAILAFAGFAIYRSRHHPPQVRYTKLTDFTDSAVAPALSADGRMVAFIRGGNPFLSSDQIYVKMLPNGEARRVTDDNRPKYGLAFSPDGAEIAYTVLGPSDFSTYQVSALGGEPHLLLRNAAGLVWLDPQHLLFSEFRPGEGIHLGVVTATVTRTGLREIYFPAHQRGMVHYAAPSPDRRWALAVEMDGNGNWSSCRLISLEGLGVPKSVGPEGACTSAAWSPNDRWMYFTATVKGQSHIWRQRFPDGKPEQITFGPTEEDGLAVEPAGHALITSVGVHESALWIHDSIGERPLSSEGEVIAGLSSPVFSRDGSALYYLLRIGENAGAELRRTEVASGKTEAVFPGISMLAFDISADGKQVVYTTAGPDGMTQLWLASLDLSLPARKLAISGAQYPHFGAGGQLLFQQSEGNANYLERMNPDGSHRSRVFPFPIEEFQSVSPGGRWVIALVPSTPEKNSPAVAAIPLVGGTPRRICAGYCLPGWSTDGSFLLIPVEDSSRTSAGRTLAIPTGPGETLPALPAEGIAPLSQPSVVPGAESVARGELVPGRNLNEYAWVDTRVHRNLYRISLP